MKARKISLMFLSIALLICATGVAMAQDCQEPEWRKPRHFDHQGIQRTYFLYVPEKLDPHRPLVFMLHGYSGKESPALDYFPALRESAERHGFVVCYPEGLNAPGDDTHKSWNVGYPFQKGWEVDDVDFMIRLKEKLQEEYDLSPVNAFFSGMSNGGEMCYQMAYMQPEAFRAIASISGLTLKCLYDSSLPAGPVPFIEIHGTADKTSLWEGCSYSEKWGAYVSVPDAMQRIIDVNGCTVADPEENLPLLKEDSHQVVLHRYRNPSGASEVRLYEIKGGVHSINTGDMRTAEEMWAFFSQFCLGE